MSTDAITSTTDTIATSVLSAAGAIINDDGSLSIKLTNLVNVVQNLIAAGKRYFVKAELVYQQVVEIFDSISVAATSTGSEVSEVTVKGEVNGIFFADESLSLHLPAPSELADVVVSSALAIAAGKTPTLKFVSYKILSVADVSQHQMVHRDTDDSRALVHRVFHEQLKVSEVKVSESEIPELLEPNTESKLDTATTSTTSTAVTSSSSDAVPVATGIITSGAANLSTSGVIPVTVSKLPVGENFSVEFEIPRGANQITINLHE